MRWDRGLGWRLGVHLLGVGLLLWLGAAFLGDCLGANPVERLIRTLGDWALYTLWATLAVTPLRRWTGWPASVAPRRTLGLWAYALVLLHLGVFVVFDHGGDLQALGADVVKRPYITLGMLAALLLTVLAVTSPAAVIRRLGGAVWRRWHRLIHPAALLALAHYYWMIRADYRHWGVMAALLGVLWWLRWPWVKRAQHIHP
ncbi:MAG: ferric reductase-like transmembrane domain-containing protein [Magnetococcus sp. WYHC-3]